jgi:hypothetical protein
MRLIGEIEAGDDYRVLIERELAMRIKLAPEATAPAAQVAPAPAATAPAPASPSASPSAAPAPVHPAAPSERPTCASCGTPNDPDAQFCKKCGARLSPL